MIPPVASFMPSHTRFRDLRFRSVLIPLAFCVALLAGTNLPLSAQTVDQVVPQAKQGYVTDLAGVLSEGGRQQLTALCGEVDQKAQAQISVVTIKTLGGRSAVDYAVDLFTRMGVGGKGTDRGVLILLAVDDHKYWTTTGYGLEDILPDAKTGDFGREAVPLLRSNNYDAALMLMTRRVADAIAAAKGVTLSGAPPPRRDEVSGHAPIPPFVIFIIIFIIYAVIRGAAGRGGRGGFGGGSGWWIWPLILSNMGGRGGNWGGGGFGGGGFGGGGGGFGGFGGGATGGGGAGGSW
jgi:uncharacterized protein